MIVIRVWPCEYNTVKYTIYSYIFHGNIYKNMSTYKFCLETSKQKLFYEKTFKTLQKPLKFPNFYNFQFILFTNVSFFKKILVLTYDVCLN